MDTKINESPDTYTVRAHFFSCSNQWFCKRCFDGAKVTTIVKDSLIYIPADSVDSVFVPSFVYLNGDSVPCLPVSEPITIQDRKGGVSVTIKPTEDKKGVEVKGDCPPKEIEYEYITNTLHTGFTWVHLVFAALAGAGAIMFLFLFRKSS